MQSKWDNRFMRLAEMVASWSKDPSTKVGAVIVDAHRRILSTGYNGFPAGADDSQELYRNREYKYANIVHAEVNALGYLPKDSPGLQLATLYSTFPPCPDCAGKILDSGIGRVVALPIQLRLNDLKWYEHWSGVQDETARRFREAGVEFVLLTRFRVPAHGG